MGDWETFSDAPLAVYSLRETGDLAHSRRIIDTFARSVDTYWTPVDGPEMASTLIVRAQMAAVTSDRAAVIDNLTRYHERGGILPGSISREPWFQAYQDDSAVADLFAKAAVRREKARQRLRSEGL